MVKGIDQSTLQRIGLKLIDRDGNQELSVGDSVQGKKSEVKIDKTLFGDHQKLSQLLSSTSGRHVFFVNDSGYLGSYPRWTYLIAGRRSQSCRTVLESITHINEDRKDRSLNLWTSPHDWDLEVYPFYVTWPALYRRAADVNITISTIFYASEYLRSQYLQRQTLSFVDVYHLEGIIDHAKANYRRFLEEARSSKVSEEKLDTATEAIQGFLEHN